MQKAMIFGAGLYGKLALDKRTDLQVDYFIDNSKSKQGNEYCGKMVISPEEALKYKDTHIILVASLYASSMIKQLKELGFNNYSVYLEPVHGFFESGELILNPYETKQDVASEKEWIESESLKFARKAVFDEVENLYCEVSLFNHIEVETINRCNGTCSFCPVNCKVDPREKAIMPVELFQSIVDQLEEIKYSGRFTTFSNNEPLLDERIVGFNRYARKHLPHARMHLYTNGTLMTIEKFKALVEVLDELIIDNYQQELKLIKPCVEIIDYCETHPELKNKVTIVLRKPNEILTSRGGDAPNRSELVEYGKDRCVLPFKQLIIRPTGQISLCCNDALGKYTLGDASKDKLLDIWYGSRFQMVRKCLYEGRENWGNCKYCDTFSMG